MLRASMRPEEYPLAYHYALYPWNVNYITCTLTLSYPPDVPPPCETDYLGEFTSHPAKLSKTQKTMTWYASQGHVAWAARNMWYASQGHAAWAARNMWYASQGHAAWAEN